MPKHTTPPDCPIQAQYVVETYKLEGYTARLHIWLRDNPPRVNAMADAMRARGDCDLLSRFERDRARALRHGTPNPAPLAQIRALAGLAHLARVTEAHTP